ncbi:hypothetical protein LguiA_030406 [Lonicera macranthoides]
MASIDKKFTLVDAAVPLVPIPICHLSSGRKPYAWRGNLVDQYSPSQQKDLTHSPHSESGPRNRGFCKPSREHEKIRTIIDDMKTNLHREKKNRQRLELANSKLVNELADSKLLVKRFMLDYEKERKARELIEEVCDELVDGKVMLEEKYS